MERVHDGDGAGLGRVRALFAEYHEWLGDVVCSHRLAEEIAALPGPYAQPAGALFLAWADDGDGPVGCIGVRPHHGHAAEIKRLYVRPEARGTGAGRMLIQAAIQCARGLGYGEVLVTTLPDSMPVAASMYERLGFEVAGPFVDHSHVSEDVRISYLRLNL